MRTVILVFCIGIFSLSSQAQEGKPLPDFTLNLNLSGFLQFGPIVQTEFRMGSSSGYLVPYVRLPYLGLLYHAIASEGFENTVSPVALGIGLQYKMLKAGDKGAWYFGGGGDLSFGGTSGDIDEPYEWKGKHTYLGILGNAGYRWRKPGKKTVYNLGVFAGPAIPLRDEWWYLNDPGYKYDDSQLYILAMIEFAIGWER